MKKEREEQLLALVKKNYQDIAEDFNYSRKKELWPEIKNLSAEVRAGDRVLDLACGNGRLLEAFLDKDIFYLGIDNSEELISFALKNYPQHKFIVGDMLELKNLKDKSFDHLFCLAALQHVPGNNKRIQVLKEMRRLINDSGQIVISNWNLWAKPKYRSIIFKNYIKKIFGFHPFSVYDLIFPWKGKRGNGSNRYYHAFTKKELFRLAKRSGLKISYFRKDDYNFWLVLKK